MSDVFISHVKEDAAVALEIAAGLEAAGYATWYYERDILPGRSHLEQTSQAIAETRAVLLLVSHASLASNEVDSEVEWTHTSKKPLVPVLSDLAWEDFEQQQPKWRRIIGSAVGINIPPEGISAVMPRIVAGLKALGIQPRSPEERAAEARARERAQRLAMTRDRATGLTEAGKWEEATAAWREYLALEPEDRKDAEAELTRVEQQAGLAQAYTQAKTALGRKDYDSAIALLKGILAQDTTNVPALRLLADAVERQTGKRTRPPWRLIGVGVAGIALIVVLVALLPRLLPAPAASKPMATAPVEVVAANTPASATKEGSSRSSPSPVTTAQGFTPTRALQPTPKATALVAATARPAELTPAAPAKQATAPLTASPVATGDSIGQFVRVPDQLISEFFAPGPSPVAMAVGGDTLWLADSSQGRIYQMDHNGGVLSFFPISYTYGITGLAWDGQALLLAIGNDPRSADKDALIMRLEPSGKVTESFRRPAPWGIYRVRSADDGSLWEYREPEGYLIQYSADDALQQTYRVAVTGNISRFLWASDGFWLTTVHGDWYRLGFDGRVLRSNTKGGVNLPGSVIVLDDQGSLWLIGAGRKVYQYSTRQEGIPPAPTLTPTPASQVGERALPRPRFKQGTIADKAIVHITNSLQGQMILELDSRFGDSDRSVIVEPGETWTSELLETSYSIFASANIPTPIAFSGNELLLNGYEYTWVLSRPE